MAEREWREATDMKPAVLWLVVVLVVAAGLRFLHLGHGIPFALGVDEPEIMTRVVRMMKTGDLNPHFFDYPGLHVLRAPGRGVRQVHRGCGVRRLPVARRRRPGRLLPLGPCGHGPLRHRDGLPRPPDRHAVGRPARVARRRLDGRDADARPRVALRAHRRAGDVLHRAHVPALPRRQRADHREGVPVGRRRGGPRDGDEVHRRDGDPVAARRRVDDAQREAVTGAVRRGRPRRLGRRLPGGGPLHAPRPAGFPERVRPV